MALNPFANYEHLIQLIEVARHPQAAPFLLEYSYKGVPHRSAQQW